MKLPKKVRKTSKTSDKVDQKLFVYGDMLWEEDSSLVVARGQLAERPESEGMDAATKFGVPGTIMGQVHPVSMSTLDFLDHVEAPDYKRVKVETSDGPAWAYECTAPMTEFKEWVRVEDGDWAKHCEKRGAVEYGKKQLEKNR